MLRSNLPGYEGGGVKILGPSSSNFLAAYAEVNPKEFSGFSIFILVLYKSATS